MQKYLTGVVANLLLAGPLTCGAQAAPSVAQILTANKAATGTPPKGRPVLHAEATLDAFGMTGAVKSITDTQKGWNVFWQVIGPMKVNNGYDGTTPWDQDDSGTVVKQETAEAKQSAVNQTYRDTNCWWRTDRCGAKIDAAEKNENGKTYTVLTITPKGGKSFEAWFDNQSHLLTKTIEKTGPQTNISTFSDFTRHDGVMIAHKTSIDSGKGEKYLVKTTLTKAEFGPAQAVSVYAPPKAQVADFSISDAAHETTVPITLVNNHIYGSVKFNGTPITAIFDTGGLNLVTPATAEKIHLKIEGKLPISGVGEGVMEAGIGTADSIEIGTAKILNQKIITMPLDAMAHVEGIPMPGMIGFETFRRFVTRIDYAAGKLTLIDAAAFDPKDAGAEVPFIINGRIPQVKGSVEGVPAVFDIDTGSRSELTVNKPFGKRNALRETHKGVDAVTGWGVGGASTGYAMKLKNISLGPVSVTDVVADLSDQDKGAFGGDDSNGNIGSGLLKRFIVTFDYTHQKMYLKPQSLPVTDIGTYDRAGMWINKSADGFEIVAVTKASPAEDAGLAKGDHITAIDGKSAADMSLADTRKRLRNDAPGTKISLSRLRDGKTQNVTVTLKDQI